MFKITNELIYTLLFFISTVYILKNLNIRFFYDKNNNIKKFGLKKNETLFNLYVVSIMLSLLFNVYLLSN
jgi:hypothetical protein